MRRTIPCMIALAVLLPATDAMAENSTYFVIGPSVGMVHGTRIDSAAATSLDATFGFHLEGDRSWVSPPRYSFMLWASGGVRLWHLDDMAAVPYVEAGVNLFLNVGGGYGYLTGGRFNARHTAHLFVGAPIMPALAFWGMKAKGLLFEPYYRPTWTLGKQGGGTFHEWGLLVKYAFGSGL